MDEEDIISFSYSDESSSESNTVSSISSGELIPIENPDSDFVAFNYHDPSSFSTIIRAVIFNDLQRAKQLVAEGKDVRHADNHGNTPLHIAVTRSSENDVEMVKYLLTLEGVDINAKNFYDQTPLLVSAKMEKETAAHLLIEAGADVRIPTSDRVTPLHYSVRYSVNLSKTLIQAGANINALDYSGDTPLHDSVIYGNLETLCMLLYYGADTTIRNSAGLTAFMTSLSNNKFEHADELFEYVPDFNLASKEKMSTLFLAINSSYPHITQMVERGADVNFNDNHYNVFTLGVSPSPKDFEFMWSRFDYGMAWRKCWPNILIHILYANDTDDYKKAAIRIILESDNLRSIISLTRDSEKYPLIYPLVMKMEALGTSYDTLHKFCAILLSCNLKVYDIDLDMVFERYDYCELFKLLLHMDIRSAGIRRFNFFPRLIYGISDNANFYSDMLFSFLKISMFRPNLDCVDYENLFDHTIYSPMRNRLREVLENRTDDVSRGLLDYINVLPQVPKLQELASIRSRDYLCRRYQITTCSQFYTILKYLEIPRQLKQLISFEIPLYRSYIIPELVEFRHLMKLLRERNVALLDSAFYSAMPFSSQYPYEVRDLNL